MRFEGQSILKEREEFRGEIEFFLSRIYEMSPGEDDSSRRANSSKRLRLSSRGGKTARRVNLEKTRRLVAHLCSQGEFQFLYDTFKKSYFEIWSGNMQMILHHELASDLEHLVQKAGGVLDISEFLHTFLFGRRCEVAEEWVRRGTLGDYLAVFTRFWCHHKRSTQIVCNVYLNFDYMYKHHRAALDSSCKEDKYLGFVQNANSFLRSIILASHPSSDCSDATGRSLSIPLVGVLVSLFAFLNEVRDVSYSSYTGNITVCDGFKEAVDGGRYERTFFMLRRVFEMFVGLEVMNGDLVKLYLETLRSYYLKVFEAKKSLGFKEFVVFVREALEFEKSLLVTCNNRSLLFPEDEDCSSFLRTSLLSCIQYGQKVPSESWYGGNDTNFGSEFSPEWLRLVQTNEGKVSWDLFVFSVELSMLEVLVSDDMLLHYSKNSQGRSSLAMLVINEEFEILEFLFKVFKRKSKEQVFRKELERCIVEQGLQLVGQLTQYRCLDLAEMRDHGRTSSVFGSYLRSLEGLLELYLKVERIWKRSFIEDDRIRNMCINEAWVQILNCSDFLSREVMRGFSLLIHHVLVGSYFFHEGEGVRLRSGGVQKRLSRVNLDVMNWSAALLDSGEESAEKWCSAAGPGLDTRTREYFGSIIHLFKCSNSKEYFQRCYHELLSQRIVYYYTSNRIGFGGNLTEISRYYADWSSSPTLESNVEMLTTKIDTFEVYLMKLLYHECGYSFINKSNFVIKDWFTSHSIFKSYLMASIGYRMSGRWKSVEEGGFEKADGGGFGGDLPVEFGSISERRKRVADFLDSSSFYEEIHSWLKSEDIKAKYEAFTSSLGASASKSGASPTDGTTTETAAPSSDTVGITTEAEAVALSGEAPPKMTKMASLIIDGQGGDFVACTNVPIEIQKDEDADEFDKERVLARVRYDVPFSLAVLSSTSWPLSNCSVDTGNGAKDADSTRGGGGSNLGLLNFLESELFSDRDCNADIDRVYSEIHLYQQFYTKIYSRSLVWSYFLGTCIMDYCMHTFWRQNIRMILTLQQGILLLSFNNKNSLVLSRGQYLVLRDNICRLFETSKLLVVNAVASFGTNVSRSSIGAGNVSSGSSSENGGLMGTETGPAAIKELELPPILRLYEGEETVCIEYNADFEAAVGSRLEEEERREPGRPSKYILDYASSLATMDFSSDFSLDYVYKEKDYVEENASMGGSEQQQYGSLYDSLKSNNYVSLFKSNKYRVEAIIMKFLKQKQRSPLLNIIRAVMEELSLGGDCGVENVQDNKIISGEVLKILGSLIRRDLLELDSENEQFYNYVP